MDKKIINRNEWMKFENKDFNSKNLDPFNMPKKYPPLILGFAGSKQTGKDSSGYACEAWLLANGFTYEKRAFADQLKQYCVDILGLCPKKLWGTDADKNELTHILWDNLPMDIRIKHQKNKFLRWVRPRSGLMSYRDVLNIVGTDIHRKYFGDQIWIDALFNKDFSQKDVLLITDIRTFEEVKAVKDHDGLIIKLTRNTGLKAEHEIQKRLDNWIGADYNYDNNGTLDDLNTFVKNILSFLLN